MGSCGGICGLCRALRSHWCRLAFYDWKAMEPGARASSRRKKPIEMTITLSYSIIKKFLLIVLCAGCDGNQCAHPALPTLDPGHPAYDLLSGCPVTVAGDAESVAGATNLCDGGIGTAAHQAPLSCVPTICDRCWIFGCMLCTCGCARSMTRLHLLTNAQLW